MVKYYKYQYRFNASHSFNTPGSNIHMHTFTITLYVSNMEDSQQVMFYDIDKIVNDYLGQFENKYLNELDTFRGVIPDLEHMGDIFFGEIKDILGELDMKLYQLDICENPLKVYQVSSRLHLPGCYSSKTNE